MTDDIDDRIRAALHAEGDSVALSGDWAAIVSRRPAPRRRTALIALASTVAITVVAFALFAWTQHGPARRLNTDEPPASVTTAVEQPRTTISPGSAGVLPYLWPPDDTRYPFAQDVARSFATDFLAMESPTIGTVRTTADGTEVSVKSEADSPATVLTLAHDAVGWHVAGAATAGVRLIAPPTEQDIFNSPSRLQGEAMSSDGVEHMTLLPYGATIRCPEMFSQCGGLEANTDSAVVNTSIAAGRDKPVPFSTDVSFTPYTDLGVLVLWEADPTAGGTANNATVYLVRLRVNSLPGVGVVPSSPSCDPGTPGSGVEADLYFFGCATSADNLSDVKWTSWTATTATGTATHEVDDCVPSCADGTTTSYPVNVTLSNPGYFEGDYVFRTVTLSPTSGGEAPNASLLFCGSTNGDQQHHCDVTDSWGYVPHPPSR